MDLIPTLRDLILIRKLQGVVLPPEEALINSYSPLRAAVMGSLNPFRPDSFRAVTYVLTHRRDHQQLVGIAQIWENRRRSVAQVVYLAPDRKWGHPTIWPRWLEGLCQRTGSGGIRRLMACLPVDDVRLPAFQQAAFHIYAREDIFRLTHPPSPTSLGRGVRFRPRRGEDAWSLARLYDAITPPVVQQAEGLSQAGRDEAICMPITTHDTRGYVLELGQDILGYAEARCGSRGAWLRFLLHPQAGDMAEALVLGVLNRLPHRRVYCSLPDYQGGVRATLREVGFESCGRQVLLVRHIAVFARKSAAELVPALERGVEMIASVAQAGGTIRQL